MLVFQQNSAMCTYGGTEAAAPKFSATPVAKNPTANKYKRCVMPTITDQTNSSLDGCGSLIMVVWATKHTLILIGGCKLEYIISISRLKEVFSWMLKIT